MREDTAPQRRTPAARKVTVAPSQVRVQVYNGAGTAGLGSRANADLANRGFDVVGQAQNWSRSGLGRTTVRYDTRYSESIKTVAAALPGARLVAVPGLGRTLEVVVGTSYAGTRAVRVATGSGPAGVPTAAEPRTAAADPCS